MLNTIPLLILELVSSSFGGSDNVVQKINQPSHALVSLTLWDVPGREEINLHSTYFRDMDALIGEFAIVCRLPLKLLLNLELLLRGQLEKKQIICTHISNGNTGEPP